MNGILGFFIEFFITFGIVYLIYYFVMIRKNNVYDANRVPVEINFILMCHKIDIKKINYKKMLLLVSLVSSFDIALIVTIVFRKISGVYLGMFISLLIIIPVSLIGYNFIGNYFAKNSDKK